IHFSCSSVIGAGQYKAEWSRACHARVRGNAGSRPGVRIPQDYEGVRSCVRWRKLIVRIKSQNVIKKLCFRRHSTEISGLPKRQQEFLVFAVRQNRGTWKGDRWINGRICRKRLDDTCKLGLPGIAWGRLSYKGLDRKCADGLAVLVSPLDDKR